LDLILSVSTEMLLASQLFAVAGIGN